MVPIEGAVRWGSSLFYILISNTPRRDNVRRVGAVFLDFAPQPSNVHSQGGGIRERVAPHIIHQNLFAQNFPAVFDEIAQKGELHLTKNQRFTGQRGRPFVDIQIQFTHNKSVAFGGAAVIAPEKGIIA